MRGRKKRTLILGILCCLLVFMGVGFAVARTTLNIGGTSTAVNTWDVRMANISVSSKSDGVTNSEEETKIGDDGVSANLQADFIKPGDYITYEVLVENNGSIDATLDELKIDISTDNEADKDLFKVENTLPENKKLTAGESITFTVTITFNKDAEKLPSGEVRFNVGLNYSQGEGLEGGGNTPGENEQEKDWDFEVDENGTITAYNYDLGTDVVVPATNYEGKEITTINEMSFYPKGNVDLFVSEEPMGMYGIIYEDEPNFTYVKDKLVAMFTMECEGDIACVEQYKAMMYACKDTNTCYNIANLEQNKTDPAIELIVTEVPNTAQSQGSGFVIADPDLPLEESMVEPQKNVTTLDLSNATNLTTIGEYAFDDVGLTSVEFGENSNVTTIENSAFRYNELTNVEIPNSVETIGEYAFSNSQIEALTFGTTENIQNQLSKNNKKELSKLGANVEKLSTSNSKLKAIGNSAFERNKIVELKLPDSLEIIGYSAFYNNQISGELLIPENLTTIGSSAFSNNQIKGELVIPENLTTIGSSAFNGNQISGELVIPQNLTTIGNYAFYNNSISKISFADNSKLNKIESYVFYNNDITELDIPSSVTEIGSFAFSSNQINELYFPKTVTTLGSSAFSNNAIQTLTIEKCNTTICSGSYSYGNSYFGSDIKALTIQSGEIGEYAFRSPSSSTSKIENLTLGEGVTTIGGSAFYNNAIVTLTIPSSLTTIGNGAFSSNQISELYFPKTVTTLGISAFSGNTFESLTIEECNTTTCGGSSWSGNPYFGNQIKSLIIESGEVGECGFKSQSDSISKIESLTLGEGVTTIGEYAFTNNAITNLMIPSSVTTIAYFAFYNNLINSLSLSKGVTSIGANAFENNQIGGRLVIPDSITTLERRAFVNNKITSLTLGNGVTTIEAYVFENNQIEGEFIISESLTTIGEYAFNNNLISKINFGDDSQLNKIEAYAFVNNDITELDIPSSVTEIGSYAFYNNQISELYFPKTVTTLGNGAFSGNTFESLTIEECKTTICRGSHKTGNFSFGNQIKSLLIESGEIGDHAFSNSGILTLDISRVTSMGYAAFSNNLLSDEEAFIYNDANKTSLNSYAGRKRHDLVIPNSVTTIGSYAFYNCDIIGELVIPETVKELRTFAFARNKITSLSITSSTKISGAAFNNNQLPDEQAFFYNDANKTSINSYAGAKKDNIIIPAGVITISYRAFEDCDLTGNLVIPEGVQDIEYQAFASNEIVALTLPSSVITIDVQAFFINSITNLTIPSNVTTIGNYAFASQRDSENKGTLSSILIKRTEEDFLANVTVVDNWYANSGNPTITYDPS